MTDATGWRRRIREQAARLQWMRDRLHQIADAQIPNLNDLHAVEMSLCDMQTELDQLYYVAPEIFPRGGEDASLSG